jgi:hypothetical protein
MMTYTGAFWVVAVMWLAITVNWILLRGMSKRLNCLEWHMHMVRHQPPHQHGTLISSIESDTDGRISWVKAFRHSDGQLEILAKGHSKWTAEIIHEI